MARKNDQLVKALREYQESLDRMTPEERAKEEARGKEIDRMFRLDRTYNEPISLKKKE